MLCSTELWRCWRPDPLLDLDDRYCSSLAHLVIRPSPFLLQTYCLQKWVVLKSLLSIYQVYRIGFRFWAFPFWWEVIPQAIKLPNPPAALQKHTDPAEFKKTQSYQIDKWSASHWGLTWIWSLGFDAAHNPLLLLVGILTCDKHTCAYPIMEHD